MRAFNGIVISWVLSVGLCCSVLIAAPKVITYGRHMPDPGQFVSQAVYIASASCVSGSNIAIATRSAILSHMNITSTATASSSPGQIGVYDAASNPISTTRIISSTFTANLPTSYPFNVGASSGITINKTDNSCVTFYYMDQ